VSCRLRFPILRRRDHRGRASSSSPLTVRGRRRSAPGPVHDSCSTTSATDRIRLAGIRSCRSARASSFPLHPEQGRTGCPPGEQGRNPDRPRGSAAPETEQVGGQAVADAHGWDVPGSVIVGPSAVMVGWGRPLKDVFSIGPVALEPVEKACVWGSGPSVATAPSQQSRLRLNLKRSTCDSHAGRGARRLPSCCCSRSPRPRGSLSAWG